MSEPIISVSGLRGIVGQTLTPDVARRYAIAFATVLPPGPVVLGRDGRSSGPMLLEAISSGLHAVGRSTIDGGVLSTPTLGVLVRHLRASGGIQVSASHNPPQYNGMKLFEATGRVVPGRLGEKVLAAYRNPAASRISCERAGKAESCDDGPAVHFQAVLQTVDPQRIRQCGFRVLLDANHGAGGRLGRMLLEALGCQVTVLGAEPDGRYQHPPEPVAENLAAVASQVRESGVDVGFCQDPDADRLAIIDAHGRYLGEEYTLALCVKHVLQTRRGPIVTNCATSRMSQQLAEQYGVPFARSAVGEANVVDLMLQTRAVFGGEGNGGPIDPRVGLVRDSFVGMALLLDAMASRQMSAAQLADELPACCILKTTVTIPQERFGACLHALEQFFSDAVVDRTDGVRFEWTDRWLLVRPSNTEPIVRIIAEGPTHAVSQELCESARRVVLDQG